MKFKKNIQDFVQKHPTLVVSVIFLLIAVVFTFPLITKITTEIPQGRGDIFQAMSNIDSRVAILTPLDFSAKISFIAKNINVYLPYVLLNLFMGKFAAYNVLFLSSFVLSGIGMFLLAMYFVKNRYAAFLAGLIFAFCPFHFYQATVVNLGTMHQEWLPFLALFLFKFFEKLQFKYFLGLAFFAFLIAMNEHQMLAFAALFIAMVAVYKIMVDKSIIRNKKFWIYVASSLGLLVILAFTMFGSMLKVATSDNNFLNAGANAANRYSIKVIDPLLPPVFHSFWSNASEFMQKLILGDSNRGSYFVGFSVLAILIYFGYLLKKKRVFEISEKSYKNNVLFWSISSLLFYLFSLGISFSIGKMTVYLPYFLVYKFLPFYENIRTTGRMFVFVELGISILFAYGFVQFAKKYSQKKLLLVSFFACLILLEFWVAPINTMKISHSQFYDQIAKDSEAYKLIEIPGSTSYEFASYAMLTNVIHGKKVFNGMPLARKLSGEFDMQQGTPVIKQLLYTIPKGNDPDAKEKADIISSFDWANSNDVLNFYNVRFVTISKIYAADEMQKLAQSFIEKHIVTTKRYEDEYLIAFEIAKKVPSGIFVEMKNDNDQFSKFNINKDGSGWREMGDGATLRVVNMSSAPQKIKITTKAKGAAGLMISSSFDDTNNPLVLNGTEQEYSFVATLKPGENIITLSVKDAAGNPVKNSNKKKSPTGAIVAVIGINIQ